MRKHGVFIGATAIALLAASACAKRKAAPDAFPAFTETGIQIVVQHPAGSLPHAGVAWPAPGNLGLIPSTRAEDGQPLTCLLVCAALKPGALYEAIPVAAVQWQMADQLHMTIIAVPVDTTLRAIAAEDYISLRIQYDALRSSIEQWVRYAWLPPRARWLGWQNEVYAWEEVYRSAQRFQQ